MKIIKPILTVLLAAVLAAGGWLVIMPKTGHAEAAADIYYCPMHPKYTSDRPGNCPICQMKLVKRPTAGAQAQQHSDGDHAAVTLAPRQVQLIGIKTADVKRRPLVRTVRAAGMIAHGVDLYKVQDEYINAYVEFITTFRDYKRFADSRRTWEIHRDVQIRLLEAEHKLLMLGLDHHQMELLKLIKREEIWNQPELMFFKSEKNYWIFAQLSEDDRGYVDIQQPVQIELPAYRDKFEGVVRSVGGSVDEETRTVRVLIEPKVDLAEQVIGMLADVKIIAELGEQLSVPKEAVMDTGVRKMVFVAKDGGVFEPREIEVGAQADGYWAVTKGLKSGEQVVVDGNFLLDSESRLRAGADASEGGEGHVH